MTKKKRIQSIRSIKKIETTDEGLPSMQEFPKDKPGVIYVRQSNIAQVRKNLHSYEMQTEEFEKHFREKMGVTGYIEIIADDEGKSGTLDIHDREGLLRVTHLIEGKELLNDERIGWVGAVHVNRLTRDRWLIVPGVLMKECFEHSVWISTLRMNFNFQDEYCRRVFMLEAEEAARNLQWMREVMAGGLQAASNRGYYDGRDVIPGYIVDYREYLEGEAKNPTHKKYIIYEPHAKVIRWLFRRFLELDGNFPALCREVEAMPFLFPAFEKNINRKSVSAFAGRRAMIQEGAYKGCYTPTAHGLWCLLTNPFYLGWWIPRNGGLIENNHEPIVDEALFSYAFKRLSTRDHTGTRIKPMGTTRNGQAEALLKKVIQGPDDTYRIYPFVGRGKLRYRSRIFSKLSRKEELSLEVAPLDATFTEKFLDRIVEWVTRGDLNRWKDRLEQAQAKRQSKKEAISKEIKQAKAQRQETMDVLDDPEIPKTKQMKIDYAQKIARMEVKIQELEQQYEVVPEEEEDAETLYEILKLLPEIRDHWWGSQDCEEMPFAEKIKLVGALTRRVILDIPSPGWLKVTIEWKIGEQDVMHQQRLTNGRTWAKEEDAIIRELWPKGDGAEILNQLPSRSYSAIKARARKIGTRREKKGGSIMLSDYFNLSMQDKRYAEEHGLNTMSKKPQWSAPSIIFTDSTELKETLLVLQSAFSANQQNES